MLAALITGEAKLELLEFPDPMPASGGVVVDIAYCGICGTDVGAYVTGRAYRPSLCGHEWAGTVSAVGRDVAAVSEGDRVVVGVPEACGSCSPCRAGHPAHCALVVDFIHGRDPLAPPHGGFASKVAVSADRVIPAHAELSDEHLAQVEPVTICVHAVGRSGLGQGDSTVVLGAGAVGLVAMQCAAAAGAGDVVVVEPRPERRAVAEELARQMAGVAVVTSPEEATGVVADRTGGVGADVVLDCVGGSLALGTAVALARRGGTVCMVGLAQGQASIEPAEWLRKEITVTAAIGYGHADFGTAMELMASGSVRVSELHTSTTGLVGLAGAFEDLATSGTNQLKVLVDPSR